MNRFLEILFVAIAAALWDEKRQMAFGISLTAHALGTHFAIHVATRGGS